MTSRTPQPDSEEERAIRQGYVVCESDAESSVEPEPDSEEERAIRQGFVVCESDAESSVEPEPDSEEERAIRQGFVVYESDSESSVEPEPDSEEERAIRQGFVVYESDSESSVEPEPDSEEERAIRQGFVVYESDSDSSGDVQDLPGPSSVGLDGRDCGGSTLQDALAEECSTFVVDTLPPSPEISTPSDEPNRTMIAESALCKRRHGHLGDEEQPSSVKRRKLFHAHNSRARGRNVSRRPGSALYSPESKSRVKRSRHVAL
ncbi:hypothetical protein C8T65DRAFT_696740 [Cerioporus squamosus]|nr:hypothetical protein C8T65DRAFT_696740 [Cerioporus squamosus]